MSGSHDSSAGLWNSLKRILDTVLGIAQTRIELFSLELHEERRRLVEAILCAAAVAGLGLITLTLATFAIVIYFWENGRMTALLSLSALYLIGTFLAWRTLRRKLDRRTALTSTLDEIKRDRESLH